MDTLKLVNIFESHNFDRDSAIELAEAINGKSGLATKEDIADVKAELKADIADVRAEIADVKAELKADIADVRADIAGLKTFNKLILGFMSIGTAIIVTLLGILISAIFPV